MTPAEALRELHRLFQELYTTDWTKHPPFGHLRHLAAHPQGAPMTAEIQVQGNSWPIEPGELYDAIVERFGRNADDVWSLLQAVRSLPAALDADRLARAMNAFEIACRFDAWPPEKMYGTHRSDCIHVEQVAVEYDRLRDNR